MAVELRVLSYNIRSLRDDAAAVVAVIKACRPDVVCIQEAPRFLRWRSKAARLARLSNLTVVTGGRTAAGNLLLAGLRVDVHRSKDLLLSPTPGLHQRGLATSVLSVGGVRFGLAGTHLDLEPAPRARHAAEIIGHLDRLGVPVVVAGDINEEPTGQAWRLLAGRYTDAYAAAPDGEAATSSALEPTRRIDGVFVDPAIEVTGCGVPDVPGITRASDHRPVLAVLRLPASAG